MIQRQKNVTIRIGSADRDVDRLEEVRYRQAQACGVDHHDEEDQRHKTARPRTDHGPRKPSICFPPLVPAIVCALLEGVGERSQDSCSGSHDFALGRIILVLPTFSAESRLATLPF